ncbi:MAG: alkaline phosphatase family protein [Candidatus Aminicenantes bacterium]|nr:alkaline phosphatase family protein [Candidatus Aminicenantes bacterium]
MKKTRKKILALLLVGCAALSFFTAGCCCEKSKPGKSCKLVLVIVVDQLRADLIMQLEDRFGPGGFRYLIDKGVWYKNAHYSHVTTLTAVGHATIFTGAIPADHGIVGNYWLNRRSGEVIASIGAAVPGDPARKILGPQQLTADTIGDELVLASGEKSRVFCVSVKDRGAILPGGFLGKAFWYSKDTGGFHSGEYYYKTAPSWLAGWNRLKKADRYKDKKWQILKDKSTYIYGDNDNRGEEKTYNVYFNHRAEFPYSLPDNKDFYSLLRFTPYADELTRDFACYLLQAEKLGQGDFIDMLSISFSVTDFVGHTFGPCSLEYEDNLLQLDVTLAKLFQFVDKTVGLDKTLVVLTGDHGVDLIPEYRQRLGMPAGRIGPPDFDRAINAVLRKKYNSKENFVLGFRNPSIYLNLPLLEKLKLNTAEVEAAAAAAVMEMEGIAFAATRSDMLRGGLPGVPALEKLRNVFHPSRSGNILVMQEPFWFLYHVHDEDAAMHGSAFSYDTHVPIFFAGPGIRRGVVYRRVSPRDIAPTISLKLGIGLPSSASGEPLLEVF